MRTGSPMSSTIAWPSPPMAPAWITSCTASSMVMKYRVTSGWVTVRGPPRSIWARKAVSTDPRLPSTLPKRTLRYRPGWRWPKDDVRASAMRFEDPSTLALLAALSVEMLTKWLTPAAAAASSTDSVPQTLLFSASDGWAWRRG